MKHSLNSVFLVDLILCTTIIVLRPAGIAAQEGNRSDAVPRAALTLSDSGTAGPRFVWLALPGRRLVALDRLRGQLRMFQSAAGTLSELGQIAAPSLFAGLYYRADTLRVTDHRTGITWGLPLKRLLEATRGSTKSASLFSSSPAPVFEGGFLPLSKTRNGWIAILALPMDRSFDPERALPIARVSRTEGGLVYDTVAFFRAGPWLFRVDETLSIPFQPLSDGDLPTVAPDGEGLVIVRRRVTTDSSEPARIVSLRDRKMDSSSLVVRQGPTFVDQGTIRDARQQLRERLSGAPVPPTVIERALQTSLFVPARLPKVRQAHVDLANRVYLTTSFKPRTSVAVLDHTLMLVGHVFLPPNERIIAVGDSSLWSLEVSSGRRALTLREYDPRSILSK